MLGVNGRLIGHVGHLRVCLVSAFENLGVLPAFTLPVHIFESLLADLKSLLANGFFVNDQALTVLVVE